MIEYTTHSRMIAVIIGSLLVFLGIVGIPANHDRLTAAFWLVIGLAAVARGVITRKLPEATDDGDRLRIYQRWFSRQPSAVIEWDKVIAVKHTWGFAKITLAEGPSCSVDMMAFSRQDEHTIRELLSRRAANACVRTERERNESGQPSAAPLREPHDGARAGGP